MWLYTGEPHLNEHTEHKVSIVWMGSQVPSACVSGWGWRPLRRWKLCRHCILTQWWRGAGTGCCWGRWWTDDVCGLRCSCLGCWMHSACGSLVHILQGAAWISEPGWSEEQRRDEKYNEWNNLFLRDICGPHQRVLFLKSHFISLFFLPSPSHLSPCLTNPNSISPQWSQKAGAR